MSVEYTRADADIIENTTFIINELPVIINAATNKPKLLLGEKIPLQFPPRITTDTKKAEWQETNATFYEPIAIFAGSSSRNLGLEFDYIIDGGAVWTGEYIAKITSTIKAYFYRTLSDATSGEKKGDGQILAPIVTIQSLYGAVRAISTWRMLDAGITWGDISIMQGGKPWNLSAKITMNLASISQIFDDDKQGSSEKGAQIATNASKTIYAEWF